jgi:hypothetical protein
VAEFFSSGKAPVYFTLTFAPPETLFFYVCFQFFSDFAQWKLEPV